MFLRCEEIEKTFDAEPVLKGVSLALAGGEIAVLLGPSGCGKTTLLRIIAGLEAPDHGRVWLEQEDITGMPTYRRGLGFVFQDYALFPHKNVHENVAFGLRMLDWPAGQIRERVRLVLRLVGLDAFASRAIHELSGGEQQRVALARSLAPAPRLLLLDEPLGALDRRLRERLMLDLRHILKEAGVQLGRPEGMTAVYVTHDQTEAFAIADRIAVMNKGQIEQVGSPMVLYRQPDTPFVARFLGMENILPARLLSAHPCRVQTALGRLRLAADPARLRPWAVGDSFPLLIRPEAARPLPEPGPEAENRLRGRIETLSFRGRYQIVQMVVAPVTDGVPAAGIQPVNLKFEFDTAVSLPPPGSSLSIALAPEALIPLERGK